MKRFERVSFLEDGDRVRVFAFDGGEPGDQDHAGIASSATLVASLTPAEASTLALALGRWALTAGAHQGETAPLLHVREPETDENGVPDLPF